MAFLTESRARGAAGTLFLAEAELRKSASTPMVEQFDVFLSHSYLDAQVILGIKILLEAEGLKVYVDWIEDTQLDRSQVTADTADALRSRMRHSASLIYAASNSSSQSKWMPWELGYFDGFRPGYVAILPLVQSSSDDFKGQEYLGLYPYLEDLNWLGGGRGFGRRISAKQGERLPTLVKDGFGR